MRGSPFLIGVIIGQLGVITLILFEILKAVR